MFTTSLALVREKLDRVFKAHAMNPRQRFERFWLPNGGSASYLALTEDTGFKLYYNTSNAWENYNRQADAHKNGVGPAVGRFIHKLYYRGRIYSGFFTEAVEPYESIRIGDPRRPNGDFETYRSMSIKIEDELREVGFTGGDMHSGNFGFIGDRLVALDFTHSPPMDAEYSSKYDEIPESVLNS